MATGCLNTLPGLVAQLEQEGAALDMLSRVKDVIERQAAEAIRIAPMIPKVDKSLV